MDTVPGRMGFLLTLVLCKINLLNTTVVSSPRSGGRFPTAIVQWILGCLGFTQIAIFEYAMILSYKKYWIHHLSMPKECLVRKRKITWISCSKSGIREWLWLRHQCSLSFQPHFGSFIIILKFVHFFKYLNVSRLSWVGTIKSWSFPFEELLPYIKS